MVETFFYGEGLQLRSKLLKEFGFEEENCEVLREIFSNTGFPKPNKAYKLSLEMHDLSLEEPYYWVLNEFTQNFKIVEKLEDSFAASENSAFFGVTQQRIGAQQDKVSQFLATTGKMVKELFQMVRELRIIDERLHYYEESEMQNEKDVGARSKTAEITLKGLFIDLVQGGAKSAASVFGMSRELEFVTLPDLFFDAPPFRNTAELDRHVEGLRKDFNESVLRVLVRHLKQYSEWKKRTHEEHKSRRRFMLQYLLQHFEIIKMYINWVKPYLRHVARLTMKERNMSSAELISAFEGSLLDIEILARQRSSLGKTGVNNCILATFTYRTRPEMKVVQEGYQRGPVHVGRFEMNFRVYGWTDQDVENYKQFKEKELMALMGDVSESVKLAMESLGTELDAYLEEARGSTQLKTEGTKKAAEQKSLMEKFFGDFYVPKKKGSKDQTTFDEDLRAAKAKVSDPKFLGYANFYAWNTYKNFKKAHMMVAW
ncbi:hypothetical protein COY27_00160 [Candidatus Woesearchaeota archaeon CG_4_10_14_0_2_um_filter_33_13]|nr:MAG: hypothetical protein COY27_00160 [Candidatus Woesearchaeota archaeon CG_4_10_14_0_2_um_filter_33_13]